MKIGYNMNNLLFIKANIIRFIGKLRSIIIQYIHRLAKYPSYLPVILLGR